MLRSLLAWMLLLAPADAEERGIWLCIGPEPLLKEAAPLCELRAKQGWEVEQSCGGNCRAVREAGGNLRQRSEAVNRG